MGNCIGKVDYYNGMGSYSIDKMGNCINEIDYSIDKIGYYNYKRSYLIIHFTLNLRKNRLLVINILNYFKMMFGM
jgi:hypothetical protein